MMREPNRETLHNRWRAYNALQRTGLLLEIRRLLPEIARRYFSFQRKSLTSSISS